MFWFNTKHVEEGTEPPRFVPIQKDFLLPASGARKLAHKIIGGEGPFQFSIPNKKDYVTVDEKTGVISISDKLVEEVERLLINQCQNSKSKPVEVLKQFRARYRNLYKLAAGEVFDDGSVIPTPIPIQIDARDVNGQKCSLYYCVFLPVDPQFSKASSVDPVSSSAPRSTNDEDRIKELERKVSRLESQIELLIEMVKDSK